jgi:signal transduction histidine kinase
VVTYSTPSRDHRALRIAATPVADIDGKRAALENRHAKASRCIACRRWRDPRCASKTDAVQLTQIFQNVFGNAVKNRSATPRQIRIVATKGATGGWIFCVRDNGIQIGWTG